MCVGPCSTCTAVDEEKDGIWLRVGKLRLKLLRLQRRPDVRPQFKNKVGTYEEGDRVYLFTKEKKDDEKASLGNHKSCQAWDGPYIVKKKINPALFGIQKLEDPTIEHQVFLSRLTRKNSYKQELPKEFPSWLSRWLHCS